jgi:hypothetical protein
LAQAAAAGDSVVGIRLVLLQELAVVAPLDKAGIHHQVALARQAGLGLLLLVVLLAPLAVVFSLIRGLCFKPCL